MQKSWGQSGNRDYNLLKEINNHPTNKRLVYAFSQSLYPITVATPVAGYTLALLKKDEQLFYKTTESLVAMGFNYVATTVLKQGIKRERPYISYPDIRAYYRPSSFSMPSGHASMAFNWATTLSLNYQKWYVVIPSYLYAAGIAYSRMNLGVHYPSDILWGSLLGISTSVITHYINQKFLKKYHPTVFHVQPHYSFKSNVGDLK